MCYYLSQFNNCPQWTISCSSNCPYVTGKVPFINEVLYSRALLWPATKGRRTENVPNFNNIVVISEALFLFHSFCQILDIDRSKRSHNFHLQFGRTIGQSASVIKLSLFSIVFRRVAQFNFDNRHRELTSQPPWRSKRRWTETYQRSITNTAPEIEVQFVAVGCTYRVDAIRLASHFPSQIPRAYNMCCSDFTAVWRWTDC